MRSFGENGAIRLTPIAPSYEASLVKLRVVTGSVGCACHMVGCSRSVRVQRVRGAVVSRAGRWLCRDALPTTSYPCRQGSPDTPFRVRHDKRVLDQLKDAPSTVSAPARTGLPRVQTGVLARETACATLSGSARLLSLSPHSFVRPAPRTFFRPDHSGSSAPRADLVKAGPQGHPSTTDLALTRSSTAPG